MMTFKATTTTLVLGFVFLSIVETQFYFSQEELDAKFEQFKNDYSREYSSESEEKLRKQIFTSNLNYIFRHNRDAQHGAHSYILGVNQFADLTSTEFARYNTIQYNGFKSSHVNIIREVNSVDKNALSTLPDSIDWTTKGVVTPIKNQGQCGSCWAFSAVASIEGQHALKTGKLVSLSEQNLVDCSDNYGCRGGSVENAFKYVIGMHGIDTESAYPYSGTYFHPCQFNSSTIGATISTYTNLPPGSEPDLQKAVATIGPISVLIDASQPSFQLYKSGVYDEPACSTDFLDHAVTVVGYGTQNGLEYWKVKNSFGTSWGEEGYILMSRNKKNQCGIATEALYPLV